MAQISVGEAASAGLRLIRREPKAVLGWALVHLAMSLAAFLVLGGMVAQILALAERADEPTMADLMGLQMQVVGLQPLLSLGALALQAVMMAAIFRAVLQPEERRWAYLRLSGQELWLGLVSIVISFGVGITAAMVMFPILGLVALAGLALRDTLGPWGFVVVGVPIFLGLTASLVWLMLRLCMAYPMSFSERNFRLFESWGATHGQAGRLFLVFVLAGLVALAIQLVGFVIGAGALAAAIGPNWRTLLAGDPLVLLRTGGAVLTLLAVAWSVLAALTSVVTTAPLADAYRQLKGVDA